MIETAYRKRWTQYGNDHEAMINGYLCLVADYRPFAPPTSQNNLRWSIRIPSDDAVSIAWGDSCDLFSAKSAALQAALARPTREEN